MATYYWGPSGGTSTGTWSGAGITNWFTDVGRLVPAVSAPTSVDDIVFDAASDNGTTFNVTIGASAVCRNITISSLDFTMTLTHTNAVSIYGSLSFPSTNLTRAGFQTINFLSTGTETVNFNGYVLDNGVTFNGAGATWTLLSNIGTNDTARTNLLFTLTAGSITLNGFIIYARTFTSSNSNARSINFGTSKISLWGNSTNVWAVQTATNFSYTGTPTVEGTYSGSTASRNFLHGSTAGATETNTPDFVIVSGSDGLSLSNARNLDFSSYSGTLGNAARSIYGNLTLSSGVTVSAGANVTTFASTSGIKTITSAGKTLDFPVTFNGVGGTWRLEDAFAVGSTRTLTLTNGTLNANDKNVSLGSFALGSGTKTLTLGSATWTVTGSGTAWNANTNVANLTVSASTGTISMTSASAKTFAGGGLTWPTLNQGGAGALTIQQSNTFTDIADTVQPATITLTSGTTQTVTQFTASGTAGNLITLNASTPGSQATLTDSGGVNSVSYMDIKDIAATGYGEWQAYTSNGNVNSGNNVGWVFDAPPAFVASEYPPELRSFTEKRRF